MPPRSRWSSRAARAPAGEPFAPTTTLGDLIDHFGERASLSDILRAAVLPKSDLPWLQIEQRIITEEPWTRRQIHWVRWFYVCEGFDLNKGWSGAFDHAAEVPVGSAAEGGPDAMETSRFGIGVTWCNHGAVSSIRDDNIGNWIDHLFPNIE